MAAFVPDFNSGLGIASLFPLAAQFNTTVGEVNNLSSNWSIFMLGVASPIVVGLVKRYGRLPVLFWGQFIGLFFTLGCTLSQTLGGFAACRILQVSLALGAFEDYLNLLHRQLSKRHLRYWDCIPSAICILSICKLARSISGPLALLFLVRISLFPPPMWTLMSLGPQPLSVRLYLDL